MRLRSTGKIRGTAPVPGSGLFGDGKNFAAACKHMLGLVAGALLAAELLQIVQPGNYLGMYAEHALVDSSISRVSWSCGALTVSSREAKLKAPQDAFHVVDHFLHAREIQHLYRHLVNTGPSEQPSLVLITPQRLAYCEWKARPVADQDEAHESEEPYPNKWLVNKKPLQDTTNHLDTWVKEDRFVYDPKITTAAVTVTGLERTLKATPRTWKPPSSLPSRKPRVPRPKPEQRDLKDCRRRRPGPEAPRTRA